MKKAGLLVFMAAINFCFFTPEAQAFQYLGELTWNYHRTQSQSGTVNENYTVTCSLSYVGGKSYLIQGKLVVPGGTDASAMILSGSAILSGQTFFITLSGSQPNFQGYNINASLYAAIDKTTFNGTVWGSLSQFNISSRIFYTGWSAGSLSLTSSPIHLANLPPVSLLLE